MQKGNHLLQESSPYLLQHAYNPVDWYPWSEQALEKAKRENKLILVSIGYAACHWCHVMEHESFEDKEVADLMNAHFVCIKVDREERPDIDQIYMDAVQLMTGQGGWPLNCVALPDGRPIWGGTYFRKTQWMDILDQLSELWRRNPDEAYGYAERLLDAMNKMDTLVPATNHPAFDQAMLEEVLKPWKATFDLQEGGYNRAPKFVMPSNWLFLLREAHFGGDGIIDSAVRITLKKVAWGGINDHLGGGFARYSVDGLWKVPHFEKMTYDNGQLLSLYAEAFRRQEEPLFARVMAETFAFMQRELRSPEGAWYASLDADSEGEEGKFYVWTKAEIDALLGSDSGWFCEYYRITERGNWEHGNNVLIMGQSPEEFAALRGLSVSGFLAKLEAAKLRLFEARSHRPRPATDDKILCGWNALMIKGCADAFLALQEKRYLDAALETAEFIEAKMRNGQALWRNYKNGKATINAFLEDYALLADAYLSLYQATFETKWMLRAKELVVYLKQHFHNPQAQMYFFTSQLDPALVSRKMEIMDNVIPASNSILANVLFELGHFFGLQDWLEEAERMLQNVRKDMARYGGGYSHWGILMQKFLHPYFEVVITGPEALGFARALQAQYGPNKLIAASVSAEVADLPLFEGRFVSGMTKVFVCVNNSCHLPVDTVEAALRLLDSQK